MKRAIFLSVLLSFILSGCYQAQVEVEAVGGYTVDCFSATIDNDFSRTYSENLNDGSIQMYWHEDDHIAVTDMTSVAKYNLSTGAGSTEGEFTVDSSAAGITFIEGKALYGISPYKAADFVIDSNNRALPTLTIEETEWDNTSTRSDLNFDLNIVIPSVQEYTGVVGENDIDRNIMIGTTEDNGKSFTFAPVAAIARFNLSLGTDEMIYSVEMSAQGENISGAAEVDLGAMTIGVATESSVTLNYLNPKSGARNDGWALIAPVDWSSSESSVLYRVVTDKGTYTFCKRPTKPFRAGVVYSFPLSVEKFTKVESLDKLENGCYHFAANKVSVAAVRTTDSTITIGWTTVAANIPYIGQIIPNNACNYTTDIIKTYKVALYRDAQCKDLVVSVANIRNSSSNQVFQNKVCPPRFVFSGLEPETTYYAKVWDTTNSTESGLIQVSTTPSVADKSKVVTSNAQRGDLVLFENFESLIYNGELSARGAGLHRSSISTQTTLDGAKIEGEIIVDANGYALGSCSTEAGLFSTMGGVVDDFGLNDWGWISNNSNATGSSVCGRPGFIKIGTSNNAASVCLPRFTAIANGQAATLMVTFKAAPYSGGTTLKANESEKLVAVRGLSDVDIDKSNQNRASFYSVTDYHTFTLEGDNVSAWKEYTVMVKNVPYGGSVAIGGGNASTESNRMLLDDIRVRIADIYSYVPAQPKVQGVVTYSDGTPAAGVSVSDGFSVVQTDSQGKYTIANPHNDAWYIYYSIPSDCKVETNSYGQPVFYTKYERGRTEYNFTLTKLPSGKESRFTLFCLADPQCKNTSQRNRFMDESLPAIKAHAQEKGVPCYGVTLGDIVSSGASSDTTPHLPHMREHMHKDNAGMPIYQTMGNHDFLYFNSSNPLVADEYSSTTQIKAQRLFEELFGPINHSWNRSDAHIICMRDIRWYSDTDPGSYSLGFSDEQYEWFKQDLSFVPKDKLVILCVHIPIINSNNKNVQNVIAELTKFDNAHIMAGHTHYGRNEPTLSKGVYEHVHGAVCGMWWWSNLNGDGMPNGYGVYDIEGNTITDGYYKGVNKNMDSRDYQIRLYRGSLLCGGSRWQYQWNMGDDVLFANVFNGGPDWTVKVYENDVYSGTMTLMSNKKYYYEDGNNSTIIDFTVNPTIIPANSNSSQDWWAIGYNLGVKSRTRDSSNSYTSCYHMYKYKLKDNTASIRVEATDPFGRTYTTTDITTDYSIFE